MFRFRATLEWLSANDSVWMHVLLLPYCQGKEMMSHHGSATPNAYWSLNVQLEKKWFLNHFFFFCIFQTKSGSWSKMQQSSFKERLRNLYWYLMSRYDTFLKRWNTTIIGLWGLYSYKIRSHGIFFTTQTCDVWCCLAALTDTLFMMLLDIKKWTLARWDRKANIGDLTCSE